VIALFMLPFFPLCRGWTRLRSRAHSGGCCHAVGVRGTGPHRSCPHPVPMPIFSSTACFAFVCSWLTRQLAWAGLTFALPSSVGYFKGNVSTRRGQTLFLLVCLRVSSCPAVNGLPAAQTRDVPRLPSSRREPHVVECMSQKAHVFLVHAAVTVVVRRRPRLPSPRFEKNKRSLDRQDASLACHATPLHCMSIASGRVACMCVVLNNCARSTRVCFQWAC
jgi:hypothetical protein